MFLVKLTLTRKYLTEQYTLGSGTLVLVLVNPGCHNKFHRLDEFNNKYLFLRVLGAGKPKIKSVLLTP